MVVGLRIQSTIWLNGGTFPNGKLRKNVGATLQNVRFSNFDACPESFAVTVNTGD